MEVGVFMKKNPYLLDIEEFDLYQFSVIDFVFDLAYKNLIFSGGFKDDFIDVWASVKSNINRIKYNKQFEE